MRSGEMMEASGVPVADASAWKTVHFDEPSSYSRPLNEDELHELNHALEIARQHGLPPHELTPQTFPLPRLHAKLAAVQADLEQGRGFVLLRGIPVERYGGEDLRLLYSGLLSHLGSLVEQDTKGTLIEEVTDRGASYTSIGIRGYTTNAELTPHCDSGDVVALLCVRPAKRGGLSQIASSMTIYNEILDNHPESLEPLYRGFQYNIRGNGPPGEWENVTRHRVPVFSYCDGRLSARFNLKAILTAEQLPGVPPLTEAERHAIELVGELAMRPDIRLDMQLGRGDVQLLNNHSILHTRTSFEDDERQERKRLLLRAWINMPNSRKLEPEFANHYNTGPRRGPAVDADLKVVSG